MPSINLIKSSDGTGNAAVATVQTTRAPGASTILVDTVDNINSTFMGTMGTPHTFVDPITAETITVISDATARDFTGSVVSTHLEITAMAPGNTDIGSAAGDVIIIKPTTDWANNIADTLAVAHNDDGTLKAVTQNPSWTTLTGATITSVTNNGNRSYTLGTSADASGAISPGFRLRTTRTVAAPTQCTSLNGTTQYYSKTSPAGMTFTDDFVVSAWVKLTSYALSGIVSRWNGTSGWNFVLLSTGQVRLEGTNAGAANFSNITSYQSLPLNKWVHITAQLDMSTFTATTTTSYIMIDGVDVPSLVSRSGTNPTALVQAGNLEVGSYNGGTSPFPGKIAQVAIFNAKVTQATMRGYMSQGLAGTETSLISAYSFNNAITDLNTTNANNLTANGSAVATNADSPFGNSGISSTLDYGIVQTINSTTMVVQVAEGCTIPTSGGVSAVSYSGVAVPYGFPSEKAKWRVNGILKTQIYNTFGGLNTWSTTGFSISTPVGKWNGGYQGTILLSGTAPSVMSGAFQLSNGVPTAINVPLLSRLYNGASVQIIIVDTYKDTAFDFSTTTTMTLYGWTDSIGGTGSFAVRGDQGQAEIFMDNAYL